MYGSHSALCDKGSDIKPFRKVNGVMLVGSVRDQLAHNPETTAVPSRREPSRGKTNNASHVI